jgi:predicted nucleic acid-binding protein
MHINMLLQDFDGHIERAELVRLNLLQSDKPAEIEFYACLADEDRIDPGEIECITLAAYRDLTLYSDDLGAFREVQAINSGTADCLHDQGAMTLPLTAHGTIWLLLKAAQENYLTLKEASDAYDFMRFELRSRLPRLPLGTIMADPSQYW